MKIYVEQVCVKEGVLIYSDFVKYTNSPDEEGSDFEYDFESVFQNVDDIQSKIIKLYGTVGLIKVLRHFAGGAIEDLIMESVEFEENSDLKRKIDDLIGAIREVQVESENQLKPITNWVEPPKENFRDIHSENAVFLINGLISSLEINDDLNVMRMLGTNQSNTPSDIEMSCNKTLLKAGFTQQTRTRYFSFKINGVTKVLAVGANQFYGFVVKDGVSYLDFPTNELQEKIHVLFDKYINITEVYALKKSVILEVDYNSLAKNSFPDVLHPKRLHFDVASAKFTSQEKIL